MPNVSLSPNPHTLLPLLATPTTTNPLVSGPFIFRLVFERIGLGIIILGRDGGILCLLGTHGSGKTTLASALAVVFSNPAWEPIARTPTGEVGASAFSSRRVLSRRNLGKRTVSEAFQKSLRVYVHLTMGACTSTTMHSGLRLCAVPQMTQTGRLLASWIEMLLAELADLVDVQRLGSLAPIKFKLETTYKASSSLVSVGLL